MLQEGISSSSAAAEAAGIGALCGPGQHRGLGALATFDQIFSQSIYLSVQPCVMVDKPCRLQGPYSPALLARAVVSCASLG